MLQDMLFIALVATGFVALFRLLDAAFQRYENRPDACPSDVAHGR